MIKLTTNIPYNYVEWIYQYAQIMFLCLNSCSCYMCAFPATFVRSKLIGQTLWAARFRSRCSFRSQVHRYGNVTIVCMFSSATGLLSGSMGALLALFKRGGDDERQNQRSRVTEQDRAILVRKENRCLCGKFTIVRTYLDPRPLSSSRETRRVWGPDYIRMQLFCDCEFGAYEVGSPCHHCLGYIIMT